MPGWKNSTDASNRAERVWGSLGMVRPPQVQCPGPRRSDSQGEGDAAVPLSDESFVFGTFFLLSYRATCNRMKSEQEGRILSLFEHLPS